MQRSDSSVVHGEDLQEQSVRGDRLTPVIDLWEPVSSVLGVTFKQASEFIEKVIRGHGLVLFVDDDRTGLWVPISVEKVGAYMIDLWNSGEAHGWDKSELGHRGWRFLRLSESGAAKVIKSATEASDRSGDNDVPPAPPQVPAERDIDPVDLPSELDTALIAFRAVRNGYGDSSATFKNRLVQYLKEKYPDLVQAEVDRIATVANPDKDPGRKPNKPIP